jgi:LacI family transcriptional regulator
LGIPDFSTKKHHFNGPNADSTLTIAVDDFIKVLRIGSYFKRKNDMKKSIKKRATIVDVAKSCGVSQATVARVLNGQTGIRTKEDTRKRVMAAAKKVGYQRNVIAANLRLQQTTSSAVSIADISNPFFPELVKGIQDVLRAEGYSVIQLYNDWDADFEQEHFGYMVRTCVEGAIISPSTSTTSFDGLQSTPFVVLSNSDKFSMYDTVGNDSRSGMRLALERLYELGHRRMALFVGGSMRSGSSWRAELFREFLNERALPVSSGMILESEYGISSTSSFAAARKIMNTFLDRSDLPTAIFSSNDILALATLQAANEKGIGVPDRLSVVGMDGIFSGEVSYPPLTTVQKNRREIGRTAALALLDKIKSPHEGPVRRQLLGCKLVERGSMGPVSTTSGS